MSLSGISDWIKIETKLPNDVNVLDLWLTSGHRATDFCWYEDEQVFKCITSDEILHRSYVSHWRVARIPEDF